MAVIRVNVNHPMAGGSAIADMLRGAGLGFQNYATGTLEEQERQRLIQAEEEAKAAQAFQVQQQAGQARLATAAQTPEVDLAKLFPPTMEAPSPGGGAPTEVSAPGANLVLNPETGQFEEKAPETTKAVQIPEHLGGGTLPGAPILSREDVQARTAEDARAGALAQRDLQTELGDRVEVTQEKVDALPEPLRPMYQDMVGQTVPRGELGNVALQTWGIAERSRASAEAEQRTERRSVAREGRASAEWDRREEARLASKRATSEIPPEKRKRFEATTVSDWRDLTANHLHESNFSTRSGITQNEAKMLAQELGKVIPSKPLHAQTLAAKADLADYSQIEELIADPEVKEWIGAYAGRIVNWESEGWLDPLESFFGDKPIVPTKVADFRAALNRVGAGERHKIYGAAVTATEVPFARAFIPALDTGLDTLEAAVKEGRDNIERGLDAMWGTVRKGGETEADVDPTDPLGIR